MIEQNLLIYGQIALSGFLVLFAIIETKIAIINQLLADLKQELNEENEAMKEVKYLNSFLLIFSDNPLAKYTLFNIIVAMLDNKINYLLKKFPESEIIFSKD